MGTSLPGARRGRGGQDQGNGSEQVPAHGVMLPPRQEQTKMPLTRDRLRQA